MWREWQLPQLALLELWPRFQALALPTRSIPPDGALSGSWLGRKFLAKVTLRFVQLTVAATMLAFGSGLALGLV